MVYHQLQILITQNFNGQNYTNPDLIEVTLQVSDGICDIDIIETIQVAGIGNLGNWGPIADAIMYIM